MPQRRRDKADPLAATTSVTVCTYNPGESAMLAEPSISWAWAVTCDGANSSPFSAARWRRGRLPRARSSRRCVTLFNGHLTGCWSGPAAPDWWHDDFIAATASPGNFRAVAERQILTPANADLTHTVVAINCDRRPC